MAKTLYIYTKNIFTGKTENQILVFRFLLNNNWSLQILYKILISQPYKVQQNRNSFSTSLIVCFFLACISHVQTSMPRKSILCRSSQIGREIDEDPLIWATSKFPRAHGLLSFHSNLCVFLECQIESLALWVISLVEWNQAVDNVHQPTQSRWKQRFYWRNIYSNPSTILYRRS